MTIDDLIKILENSIGSDHGLRYHNGRPERRYDPRTGEPYYTNDPTELSLFGQRANDFYSIVKNAAGLAAELRALRPANRSLPKVFDPNP